MIPDVLIEPVDPIPTPVRPEPSPKNADAVTIPVTLIPLGLILSIDEPEETTVTCPNVGEKNPV
jgi:hypothetical protein